VTTTQMAGSGDSATYARLFGRKPRGADSPDTVWRICFGPFVFNPIEPLLCGGETFDRRVRLDYIPASTRAQGFVYDVGTAVLAHKQDLGRRGNLSDSARRFNSIYSRETDVEENQVWL